MTRLHDLDKVPMTRRLGNESKGRTWTGDSLEFGERFFMKETKERASGAVKKDWESSLIEAKHLGQHARTEETNFGQSRFGHPDSYFKDEQVKASDALINEVGSLLTESGKAQIIDTVALDSFVVRVGDLQLKQGFASDLCENKPYGPHEDECWDLGKNNDVKELFEIIGFERPMIVAGSPPCTACSQFQNVSWRPEWEKRQATKLLHVAMDVYEKHIRRSRHFLRQHPLEASSWWTLM